MAKDPEQLNREVIELLNELRVVLPGVQVLLAFLLVAPFNQRFTSVTPGQKGAYFFSLLCTAAATAFLIATATYHRIQWRERDKEHMLRLSNRLILVGTGLLAAGIVSSIYVVTSLLYDGVATVAATLGAAVLFAWLWYGLPLARRLRR